MPWTLCWVWQTKTAWKQTRFQQLSMQRECPSFSGSFCGVLQDRFALAGLETGTLQLFENETSKTDFEDTYRDPKP